MEPDPILSPLVEALKTALAQTGRRLVFVQLLYSDATVQTVPVPTVPREEAPPPGERRPGKGGQRLRKLILEQLARLERPVTQAGLARKCGRKNSGHFRDTLEAMVEGGEVRRLPTGHYWLPGRNLPAGWQGA
jgi:hypothetical protein